MKVRINSGDFRAVLGAKAEVKDLPKTVKSFCKIEERLPKCLEEDVADPETTTQQRIGFENAW
jgi:hypothetical protein